MNQIEKLDANVIRKQYSRRGFLKSVGVGGLVGILSGYATKQGTDYVINEVGDIVSSIEREVRKAGVYLDNLKGTIDKKLAEETSLLEK